jgi:hypothetical protein
MNRTQVLAFLCIPALVATVGCVGPSVFVYSSGFSFSKYDFLIFEKPDEGSSTPLYGMDIEVGNELAHYNMNIIGDKEFATMNPEDKPRTLYVRFAISSYNKMKNLIAISFDDATTGKTVATLTAEVYGSLMDPNHRANTIKQLVQPLSEALTREKGLKVTPG